MSYLKVITVHLLVHYGMLATLRYWFSVLPEVFPQLVPQLLRALAGAISWSMRLCDLALVAIAARRNALKVKTYGKALIGDCMVQTSKDLTKKCPLGAKVSIENSLYLHAYLQKTLSKRKLDVQQPVTRSSEKASIGVASSLEVASHVTFLPS